MRRENVTVMKKVQFMILMMAALLLMAFATQKPVEAAAKKPSCVKKQTIYYTSDHWNSWRTHEDSYSGSIYIKNINSNARIIKVKSSNKDFTAVVSSDTNGVKYISVRKSITSIKKGYVTIGDVPIESGTKTTVSFTVKQNGKKYRLKTTVTFKERPTPLKSLKIGSVDYAGSFSGHKIAENVPLSGTSKISVKMKSGYKVTSIKIFYKGKGNGRKVKNNTTVSLDNISYLYVNYKHTKKPKNSKNIAKSTLKYYMNDFVVLDTADH